MHFTCRSFIGKNNSQNWSQYWENEPDDINLQQEKGHLFGLIDFSSSDNPDIKTTGHNIIEKINQLYFASTSPDIISNLKNTIQQLDQYADFSCQLNLILIVS